jgi:isopenicillin-N epimerase
LYDEFQIEIPLIPWQDKKLIRVSIQGYNSKEDVDRLLDALSALL